MVGHKSVVSSLAVSGGILYSGSWDGTIRLWWLNDHSPLSVLGEDTTGSTSSVLSLSVDSLMLAASHENGCIKVDTSSNESAIFIIHEHVFYCSAHVKGRTNFPVANTSQMRSGFTQRIHVISAYTF